MMWAWCSNCGRLAELKGMFAYQIHRVHEPYAASLCDQTKEHDWFLLTNGGRQKVHEKENGYLVKEPMKLGIGDS